ncbi:TIGR04086 family membrane protein [Anaeroselena agilis]|uniref:TIGR04086 family membrane protein n=1 Tax=Anaeroselena agilis TaxID=3063788 RepID=A0ABU3NXB6_9FIRM|nr:TIGR04086 family membrane protein [Selenomonadales bacterium 4137-cl]
MAKVTRRTRVNVPTQRLPGAVMAIGAGVLVSLIVSLVAIVFLSVVSLATESLFVESYLRYIMVAVTVTSIFIGSAFAARRAGGAGLLVGMAVGFMYVLISVGVGLEMTQEPVSLLVLANKAFAGIAAGALGGLVGVNL